MYPKDRGLLFALTHVATIPIALLPGWLAWRYAHSRPRNTTMTCPNCQWVGAVQVADTTAPVQATQSAQVVERVECEGIPLPTDPVDARRERQQRRLKRARRQAREREHESEPNPEFDFGESEGGDR